MRNFKQVDEKYSFTLDNKQIAFLATGALALFLLFFVLGVLYGKGLGEGSAAPAAGAPVAAAPVAPAAEAELESGGLESSQEPSSGKPGEKVFQLEEEDLSAGTAPAPPKAASKEAVRQAVVPSAPAAPPSRQGAPAPSAAKGHLKGMRLSAMKGSYTIQVASFTDAGDAKQLARKLEGEGYPAYTTKASVRGRVYYRVRIGRFGTNSEAQAQAASFKQAEKTDAIAMRIE